MGEFPSGQRGQTVNLLLIASVVRIHLPPPAKRTSPKGDVLFAGGENEGGFEPTQIQHAGGMLEKPVQTLVFSLPLSIGKRAIESTFPVLRHQLRWWVFCWWGKNRGFEPTQIQHAGGMLAKPVRTLVFSLPLSPGKRAIESTFPRTAPPATLVVFLWKNVVDWNPLKPVQPLVLPGLSYGRLPKPVFSAHFRRRPRYCSFISGV